MDRYMEIRHYITNYFDYIHHIRVPIWELEKMLICNTLGFPSIN
jgi:hypothetical protein